jgi:hypothetical protein
MLNALRIFKPGHLAGLFFCAVVIRLHSGVFEENASIMSQLFCDRFVIQLCKSPFQ